MMFIVLNDVELTQVTVKNNEVSFGFSCSMSEQTDDEIVALLKIAGESCSMLKIMPGGRDIRDDIPENQHPHPTAEGGLG